MPELLAATHVRDVHLDHRQAGRFDGVTQGDRGVGKCARVEHGPDRPPRLDLGAGLLYPVDQLAFVVRLPEDRLQAELTGLPPAQVLQLGERRRSVDLRAARSQQVEIRAVQDEHRCHAASFGSDAKVDPPDITVATEVSVAFCSTSTMLWPWSRRRGSIASICRHRVMSWPAGPSPGRTA